MFSSVESIADNKVLLDSMIKSDFEDPRWWRSGWVPFPDNGAGDYLCLDMTAEDGGTPGQVLQFYHDWENRPIRSPSMEAWLKELVSSMESSAVKWV
jgi:cell wall assembly regulator SMI1